MKTGILNSIPRESVASPFFFASLFLGFLLGDIAVLVLGTDTHAPIACAILGLVFGWSCLGCAFGRAQESEREREEIDIRWAVVPVLAWCFFLIFWLYNWESHYTEDIMPYWALWSLTLASLVEASIYTLAWVFLRKDFSLWFKRLCTEEASK